MLVHEVGDSQDENSGNQPDDGEPSHSLATLHLATKADLARFVGSLGKAIAKLEGSLIKWMVGTVISAVAAAFAVAKFVS